MRLRLSLLGIAIVGAVASAASHAEEAKPFDFKPLVPPLFPMPPDSQLHSGPVGGTQTPYTTAPLQNPQAPTQPAPGVRFSIPR